VKKYEILAPAGSKEAMIGAINAGADAIYLAGKRFGARAYANNFDDETLFDVITYAHLRGVLVYVAINTVIFDDEIDDLIAYTDTLVMHDVDALIVQDLGVMDLLLHRYPHVDIHASTQMNTHAIEQVKWLKDQGVKRVVLARETSLDLIKRIKKEVDIEIEVFVHGALCVCYSGNCLMSSMIGGRSGNRGECAQPCRLPYSLHKNQQKISDQTYLLSTKDLMTIEYMDELVEAGIDSFKIEGRMRKPEYVIETVKSYREALDASLERKIISLKEAIWGMKRVFNREYTKGFLMDETPSDLNNDFRPNHMGVPIGHVLNYSDGKATIKLTDSLSINDGYRIVGLSDYGNSVSRIIKGDQLIKKAVAGEVIKLDVSEKIQVGSQVLKTLDIELEQSLSPYLNENYKVIAIIGEVEAYVGKPLKMSIHDYNHHVTIFSDHIIEYAKQAPITQEQLIDQLSKLGQTPFYFDSLIVKTDGIGFIPIKVMNDIRRKVIDELTKRRLKPKKEVVIISEARSSYPITTLSPRLAVKVQTIEQYEKAKNYPFDVIYAENILMIDEPNVIPSLKRIQLKHHETIRQSSLIQDIGHLNDAKNYDLITDGFFNVTNMYSIHLLHRMGIRRITLSPEVSFERIKTMIKRFPEIFHYRPSLELEVYGRQDLMITKYCPIAKTFKTKQDCHLCEKNQYTLEDRMGSRFPLIHDGHCNLRLLHDKPLHLRSYLSELLSLGVTCRIHLTTEKGQEIDDVLNAYTQPSKGFYAFEQAKKITSGRFLK